jgi:hypothetical protein
MEDLMAEEAQAYEASDEHLARIKQALKAGRLEPEDLKVLERLVERTEQATRQLRAAVVE